MIDMKAKALVCAEVLESEFVGCKPGDYEAGCVSCEALRIATLLREMAAEGAYDAGSGYWGDSAA